MEPTAFLVYSSTNKYDRDTAERFRLKYGDYGVLYDLFEFPEASHLSFFPKPITRVPALILKKFDKNGNFKYVSTLDIPFQINIELGYSSSKSRR